jgi:hypothetical protein
MVGRLLIRPTMSIFSFDAICGNSAPLIWRIILNRKWLANHLIVQRCVQRKIEVGPTEMRCQQTSANKLHIVGLDAASQNKASSYGSGYKKISAARV